MSRIALQIWKPRPDGSGYLDLERTRTVGEVHDMIRERVGDYPYGGEEYFNVALDTGVDEPWPEGRLVCFAVVGSSEGDYVHVETHVGNIRKLVFLGKTFDGPTAAWAFARRLYDMLEEG